MMEEPTTTTAIDPFHHPSFTPEQITLIREVVAFTKEYFQNPRFDSSHDFQHVMRVVRNAVHILDAEQRGRTAKSASPPSPSSFDRVTVILGALLHDVDDKKYVDASQAKGQALAKQELLRLGVSEDKASVLQTLIDGVSFSSEVKDPERVRRLIREIPELAIVQDADRLDAIGAIGIGRCFAFGAVKNSRVLGESVEHFEAKLVKLEGMMKTAIGRKLAADRSMRLREFMGWWSEETEFSGPA